MKEYRFKINGQDYDVVIDDVKDDTASLSVNGRHYDVAISAEDTASKSPAVSAPASVSVPSSVSASKPAGQGSRVTSPLPGIIVEISVEQGQRVRAGQKLAVIEAMKMENEIQAEMDGVVTAIHVNKGDSVLEGAEIVTIA